MSTALSGALARVLGHRWEELVNEHSGSGTMKLSAWSDQEDRGMHRMYNSEDDREREVAADFFNLGMNEVTNKILLSTGGQIQYKPKFTHIQNGVNPKNNKPYISKERMERFKLSTFSTEWADLGVPKSIVFSDADDAPVPGRFLNLLRSEDRRDDARTEETNLNYQVVDIDHNSRWRRYTHGVPYKVENIATAMLKGEMAPYGNVYQYLEDFERWQGVWNNQMGQRRIARDFVDTLRMETEGALTNTTGIDGVALTPLAYVAGADTVERDYLTIAAAIRQIENQMFNEATADGAGTRRRRRLPETTPVYVMFNKSIIDERRVRQALAVGYDRANERMSIGQFARPVIAYGELDINLGTQVMVTAPRGKMIHVPGRDIRFDAKRDPLIVGVSRATIANAILDIRLFSDAQRALANFA